MVRVNALIPKVLKDAYADVSDNTIVGYFVLGLKGSHGRLRLTAEYCVALSNVVAKVCKPLLQLQDVIATHLLTWDVSESSST
jgi:hypothetical protein